MKQLLIETRPLEISVLSEEQLPEDKRDGRMRIVGRFQQADIANENRRLYRRSILEREVAKLNERLRSGVASAADHPSNGKTAFRDVAAKLEELAIGEDGWVSGRMVMLNTAVGKDAQEIIRSGIQVHVSARGFGTLKRGKTTGGSAVDEVQEDYNLVTYDLVMSDPGFKGADIQSFTEEKREMKTVEDLRKEFPELVAEIEKAAGEKAVTEAKDGLTKEIREQLEKDQQPTIDKLVEEKVAAERDAIKAEVLEHLKAAGIEESKAILAQIAELVSGFAPVADPDNEPAEADEQLEALKAQLAELTEQNEKLLKSLGEKEAAEKAAADKLALKEHIDKALATEAGADKIRPLLESCKTIAEVDEMFPKVKAIVVETKEPAPVTPPKGAAPAVEGDKTQLTEEQARQRQLAGIV